MNTLSNNEKPSLFKSFMRGGHLSLHEVQMSANVIKMVLVILLSIGILTFSLLSYYTIPNYQWKIMQGYGKAKFYESFHMDHRQIKFVTPQGIFYLTPAEIIYHSPGTKRDVENVWKKTKQNALYGLFGMGLFSSFFFHQLYRKGKKQQSKNYLRGGQIVSPRKLNKAIKEKHKQSKITLGKIKLIAGYETRGFLFLGAPGTGKTQAFYHLLDYAQRNGQPAIIFDAEGVFTQHFYREGHDIIFNIADKRTAPWSLWTDCSTPLDYDEMAAALIPHAHATVADPFWNDAARLILSVALQRMAAKGIKSTGKLLKYLTTADFNRIRELGKGTTIDSFSNEEIAKLAHSIKAILSRHLHCIRFLVEAENEFSIRNWVHNPQGRCIFISCPEKYKEILTPLISAWLRIACNEMLDLEEDRNRRIWLFADEMHVINNISAIQSLIPRARKRGCCVAIGLQDLATLEQKHGRDTAKIFSANIRTRIFYGSTDYETADWISRTLGKQEISTHKENISYGAKENRSGLSQQESQEAPLLVMPEEVMRLPDLQAYLQIVGDLPITQITIPLKKLPKIAPAYIPRELVNLMDITPDEEEPPPSSHPPATIKTNSLEPSKTEEKAEEKTIRAARRKNNKPDKNSGKNPTIPQLPDFEKT